MTAPAGAARAGAYRVQLVAAPPGRGRPAADWCTLGVGLLAFGLRLATVLLGGGLGGLMGYDDGVYYAGADALVSGCVPYRDFLLLHPPGILLALAPFAELGRLTSDATGLAVARVAFMGVGALNAVLVLRIASRFGRLAAVVVGVFYARRPSPTTRSSSRRRCP